MSITKNALRRLDMNGIAVFCTFGRVALYMRALLPKMRAMFSDHSMGYLWANAILIMLTILEIFGLPFSFLQLTPYCFGACDSQLCPLILLSNVSHANTRRPRSLITSCFGQVFFSLYYTAAILHTSVDTRAFNLPLFNLGRLTHRSLARSFVVVKSRPPKLKLKERLTYLNFRWCEDLFRHRSVKSGGKSRGILT